MEVFESTGEDENFQLLTEDYLAMGGQQGYFGLMLNKNLSQGRSNSNVTTFHSYPNTSTSSYFNIDKVEVWGIGPEPDLEEEKGSVQPRQPSWNISSSADEDDITSGNKAKFEYLAIYLLTLAVIICTSNDINMI